MATEICANCNSPIGALEPAMLWNEQVVCTSCHRRLSEISKQQPATGALAYSNLPPPTRAKSSFRWGLGVTFGVFAAIIIVIIASTFAVVSIVGVGVASVASSRAAKPQAAPASSTVSTLPATAAPAAARVVKRKPDNEIYDAGYLIQKYKANEIQADQELKGYFMQVRGVVTSIAKGFGGRPYVTLGTGDRFELSTVQFIFTPAEENYLTQFKVGDQAIFEGKCAGKSITNVMMQESCLTTADELLDKN